MKYKYECEWCPKTGWHFSFGIKKMWQCGSDYIVADFVNNQYENHEIFDNMQDALDFMRTGKR